MNRERLLRLANFLENEVPEDKFDMSIWADGVDLNACGTAACSLGWATRIPEFGLGLRTTKYGNVAVCDQETEASELEEHCYDVSMRTARRVFDLDHADADYIFGDDGDVRTTLDASDRIRELVTRDE